MTSERGDVSVVMPTFTEHSAICSTVSIIVVDYGSPTPAQEHPDGVRTVGMGQ